MVQRQRSVSPLDSEHGTLMKQGGVSVALGYPAPYAVGVSSLGFQTVYKLLNQVPELACYRFFMPAKGAPTHVTAVENGRPVSNMHAVLFSIACEQELMGVAALLQGMGLCPVAEERSASEPPVIIGGPLTTVDPRLVAPFADLVVVGAADHLLFPLGEQLVETRGDKGALMAWAGTEASGVWIPASGPPPCPVTAIPRVPASAATWSPEAEFRNLFLVEATRGCRRGCAFCTMSRHGALAPPFHFYPAEDIFDAVPDAAPGVGLVGAAVTDHPEIERIVAHFFEQGRRASLSSIRADRLTPRLASLLKQGGGRTITLAADGASEAVRRTVKKGISEKHLLRAVETAREVGFQSLKIYSMVGLPGEEDEDILEYARLLIALSGLLKVSTTVQAFVPKPATPLADFAMVDVKVIEQRLDLLRRATKGRVKVLPTSPKWSWVDWKIAHAKEDAASMALDALAAGGNYSAWKRAIARFTP